MQGERNRHEQSNDLGYRCSVKAFSGIHRYKRPADSRVLGAAGVSKRVTLGHGIKIQLLVTSTWFSESVGIISQL